MTPLQKLIESGKRRGFITLEEFQDVLPPEISDEDQIQDFRTLFEDMGIEVRDNP